MRAILFLVIVGSPLQPRTRTDIAVLWPTREPGGKRAAIPLNWMDYTITERTHLMPTESTGITGKDITTPSRKLKWKSDRCKFEIFVLFISKSWRITCRGKHTWQRLKRAFFSLVLRLFKWLLTLGLKSDRALSFRMSRRKVYIPSFLSLKQNRRGWRECFYSKLNICKSGSGLKNKLSDHGTGLISLKV